MPVSIATFVAHFLPILDILAGVMLVFGLLPQAVSVIAFNLLLVFAVTITVSLVREMDNDCGCFKHVIPVQWRLVYRNIFLMGLVLPIFALKGGALTINKLLAIQTSLSHPNSTIGLVVLASIWGIVLLIILLLHHLLPHRPKGAKQATPF